MLVVRTLATQVGDVRPVTTGSLQFAGGANMPPGHAHIHVRSVPVRVGGQGGAGPGRPAPSEEERISQAAQEQQGEVKH